MSELVLIATVATAYISPCAEHGAPEDEATPEGRYAEAEEPAGVVDDGATGSANLRSDLSRARAKTGKSAYRRKKTPQIAITWSELA